MKRKTKRVRFKKKVRHHVYLHDFGLCRYCGLPVNPLRFDIAHEIPWSDGGSDELDNLALSHPSCNRRAGAKRMPMWMRVSYSTILLLVIIIYLGYLVLH